MAAKAGSVVTIVVRQGTEFREANALVARSRVASPTIGGRTLKEVKEGNVPPDEELLDLAYLDPFGQANSKTAGLEGLLVTALGVRPVSATVKVGWKPVAPPSEKSVEEAVHETGSILVPQKEVNETGAGETAGAEAGEPAKPSAEDLDAHAADEKAKEETTT